MELPALPEVRVRVDGGGRLARSDQPDHEGPVGEEWSMVGRGGENLLGSLCAVGEGGAVGAIVHATAMDG